MISFINKLVLMFAFASAGTISATDDCRIAYPPIENDEFADSVKVWSEGNKQFTTALYPHLHGLKNFVFSPISLQMGFAMTAELAYGETRSEILSTISLPVSNKVRREGAGRLMESLNTKLFRRTEGEIPPSHQLALANGSWLSNRLVAPETFEMLIRYNYMADFRYADFDQPENVRQEVNLWADQTTYNQIPELMPEGSITRDSKLILANTLYMNAPWANPFEKELTYEAPFYGLEKSLKPIPYLHRIGQYVMIEGDDYRVVELPIANTFGSDNELSMFIVVPNEDVSIDDIEGKFCVAQLVQWINHSESPKWVDLSFPKFKVTTKLDPKDILRDMGMHLPLSSNADFALDGEGKVAITDLIHEVVFEVDESGITAAAATGISIGLTCIVDCPEYVNINRPFLFFVAEKSQGIVLFSGRMMQP